METYEQTTFNEASFDREFESKWAGAVEGAFFDLEQFNKHRVIEIPESEPNGRNSDRAYYALGVDVGRLNCTTEVIVMKVTPAPTGVPIKQIVNLYSFDEEHFRAQAIKIKRIFKQFKCKIAVIDGNGLGVGLIDELVLDQEDPDTGELLVQVGQTAEDLLRRRYVVLTRRGEDHSRRLSHKKAQIQFLLHMLQQVEEGGLGNVQRLGGTGQISLLCNFQNVPQLSLIHAVFPLCALYDGLDYVPTTYHSIPDFSALSNREIPMKIIILLVFYLLLDGAYNRTIY